MRIISGRLGGRTFAAVPGHRTHPMSEKIRGALFNALGDINNLTVLDGFAGTGALSLEALSRGARTAHAVELDKTAVGIIKANAEDLGVADQLTVTRAGILAWSRRNQLKQYDLVVLDPPYDAVSAKELLQMTRHAVKGGLIVLSLPPNNGFRYAQSQQGLVLHKNYGDAELFFYRQLV